MPTTISRAATRRIAALRDSHTVVVARELRFNFERVECDPAAAWKYLAETRTARLTDHGDHLRVSAHTNLWFELREPAVLAEEPTAAGEDPTRCSGGWTARGRAAFEAGTPLIPGADPVVTAAISGLAVGEGAADIMRWWSNGWTAANLAQESAVPNETADAHAVEEEGLSTAALRAAELVRFDPETAREWLTRDEDGNHYGDGGEEFEPRYLDYLCAPGAIDAYYLEQLVADYCGDEGGPGFGEVCPLFWLERERRSAGQAEGCHLTVSINPDDDYILRVAGTWKELGELIDLDGDTATTVDRLVVFLSWVAQETAEVIGRSFAAIDGGAA